MTEQIKIPALKVLKTFFLFSSLLIACSAAKKNATVTSELQSAPLGGWGAFDKQGHRGCRGLMPENTIAAMINAVGLGVTTLELDVCISKDKKVFLSHEPFLNHEITTKPDGGFISEKEERSFNTYQMNYDDISKYDVGMKPHPRFPDQQKMKAVKPLLSDVFKAVHEYMIVARRPPPFFNIETKTLPIGDDIYHPKPAEFIELLIGIIKEYQLESQVIIQSFDFRTLHYLHKHYPNIKTAILIEDSDMRTFEGQLKALGFTPTIYSPAFSLVTKGLISKCHEQNIKVIPWTVNDKKQMGELKMMGVDGIITDYPNLFND